MNVAFAVALGLTLGGALVLLVSAGAPSAREEAAAGEPLTVLQRR